MAVTGWESFRDKFEGYEDCYTVIGGFACEILLRHAQLNFRATKDIDMILLIEDRLPDFGKVFWDYIKEGEYQCGWKQSPELHFYRFTEPKSGFPVQIELFSRLPDYHLNSDSVIVPIHIDGEISSLSAIVMNDDFYNLLQAGRTVIDGVSTLNAEYLIPFKMYAWTDLLKKKDNGVHVNDRDLTKHKLDVFRLLQVVTENAHVDLTGLCLDAASEYIDRINSETINMEQIGLAFTQQAAIQRLKELYSL